MSMNRGKDLELLFQVAPDRVVSMMVDVRSTVANLKREVATKFDLPEDRLVLSTIDPPSPPLEMEGDRGLAEFKLVRRTTIYVEVLEAIRMNVPPGERRPPMCGVFIKVLRSMNDDGPAVNEKDTILSLDLLLTQPVLELKLIVARILGVPPERQRLVYQGQELNDKMTLVHYHVVPRSVIHLWPLTGWEEY